MRSTIAELYCECIEVNRESFIRNCSDDVARFREPVYTDPAKFGTLLKETYGNATDNESHIFEEWKKTRENKSSDAETTSDVLGSILGF